MTTESSFDTQEILTVLCSAFSGYEPDQSDHPDAEYVVREVREAVLDDIILLLSRRLDTVREARNVKRFRGETSRRDWDVAESHLREIISEIRQYKTRGLHSSHTEPVSVREEKSG